MINENLTCNDRGQSTGGMSILFQGGFTGILIEDPAGVFGEVVLREVFSCRRGWKFRGVIAANGEEGVGGDEGGKWGVVGGEVSRRRDHDGGQGVAGDRRGKSGLPWRTRHRFIGWAHWCEEPDMPDFRVGYSSGQPAGVHFEGYYLWGKFGQIARYTMILDKWLLTQN